MGAPSLTFAVDHFLQDTMIPEPLQEHHRQDFVPYFLNYLRDQSTPLLQSGSLPSPSPVCTPVQSKSKKLLTPKPQFAKRPGNSGNRVQLFAPSPAEILRSEQDVLASPNTSLDSPGMGEYRTRWKGDDTPKSGVKSPFTPDHHRSKNKQTLGDFLFSTPENSGGAKKKSPHWSRGKESPSKKNFSPSKKQCFSPTKPQTSRRSGGGRKSLENARRVVFSSATPIQKFNVNNISDFPPMDAGGKNFTPSGRYKA